MGYFDADIYISDELRVFLKSWFVSRIPREVPHLIVVWLNEYSGSRQVLI